MMHHVVFSPATLPCGRVVENRLVKVRDTDTGGAGGRTLIRFVL